MLEPNWEQDRPPFGDVQKMWEELQISYEPLPHPALDEVLHHLRATHVNGGTEFAQFKLSKITQLALGPVTGNLSAAILI